MPHEWEHDDLGHRAGMIGSIVIQGGGTIPMYENPKIREGRKAGYNRTNIFKRDQPVRLWVGGTAATFDVEVRYTLPHMEALGGVGTVKAAIAAARNSVKGRGSKGPATVRMSVGTISYPQCIVTSYEIDMPYEHGSYNGDSRVIIIRLQMEEYSGFP